MGRRTSDIQAERPGRSNPPRRVLAVSDNLIEGDTMVTTEICA